MKHRLFIIFILVVSSLVMYSCGDESYTPRPKGYFRIEMPDPVYSVYENENCPYVFELPQYAVVRNYQDSVKEPCWKYIQFPDHNAEIFLSYKKVNNDVGAFMEDARALAYKHTIKADAIDETIVENPGKLYGIIYDIGGSAASSVQFYATDSTTNFIRGALYFNVAPQPDSLAPVIKQLRKDIEHLMTTIRWK